VRLGADKLHSKEFCAAMTGRILLPLALTLITLTPAMAASPQQQRGKVFAMNNCAKCHAIDKVSPSPLKIAPPFRTLHKRYPVESLAEALAEGIQTGHPTMPEFQLGPDQIGDLLAYLKSLE
jgi:cytochrome c